MYTGIDPISKRRNYLYETVPVTTTEKDADAEADRVLTRLINEVNEGRNPKTKATFNQLLDKGLEVQAIEWTTRKTYLGYIRNHIRPLLGEIQVAKLEREPEIIDSFYAELRTCRAHCGGRRYIQHRTKRPHTCDEHKDTPCSPPDSNCRSCQRMCEPHQCKGLGKSTVRQIHAIVSGMLSRAVRWKWIGTNPARLAEPGAAPKPDPQPPSAAEVAALTEEAWRQDDDWGSFLWTKFTSGARRGEMCALRLSRFEEATKVLTVRASIYRDETGQLREKDTKTHQQRRVVLDDDTCLVIVGQIARLQKRAAALGVELVSDPYIWSPAPDGSVPPSPNAISQRFERLAKKLDIDARLKNCRHYSATELIAAGTGLRTVGGRLGHSGGGTTTLRVYTAWLAEADQRAAVTLSGRMPALPERAKLALPPTQDPMSLG